MPSVTLTLTESSSADAVFNIYHTSLIPTNLIEPGVIAPVDADTSKLQSPVVILLIVLHPVFSF